MRSLVAGDRAVIIVGRCGAPHGVQGWVRVRSFTDPAERLIEYEPWYLQGETGWASATPVEARPHRGGFLVRLEGVEDRDAAGALNGCAIGIDEHQLPPAADEEFYWKDLIGLEVRDRCGRGLGRVIGLTCTGAHDLLVVQPDAGEARGGGTRQANEMLIPFVRDIVIEIDLTAGRLVADWDPDY